MKLKTKLLSTYLSVGIVPLLIVGGLTFFISKGALEKLEHEGQEGFEKGAYQQLISMRESKLEQVREYFNEREADLETLAANMHVQRQNAFERIHAINTLKAKQVRRVFKDLKDDVKSLAMSLEVHEGLTELASLTVDLNQEAYSDVYSKYYRFLDDYVTELGYYDVFLVDRDGQVVFTQAKESDLGADLEDGALRNEGLGRLWQRISKSRSAAVQVEDFAPYSPSGGDAAAFAGVRVLDADGKLLGMVALQLPKKPFNSIVQERSDLGETGETYLTGKAHGEIALRSDLLTMGGGKYVVGYAIETEYIREVIGGKAGQEIFTDSSGTLVLVAYEPLDIKGVNWGIVTKINLKEVMASEFKGTRQVENSTWKNDYYSAFVEKYGYYDLFLIHPEGQVFYSVCEEADYQSNMLTGPYRKSGLAEVLRKVKSTRKVAFADFAPYEPSDGKPAAFIGVPIVHGEEIEFVVVLQLSSDGITKMVSSGSSVEERLEAYLVGEDFLMRSDATLSEEYTIEKSFAHDRKIDSEAVKQALEGNTGNEIVQDYNGNKVISAYAPVKVFDTTYALLCEIDKAKALAKVAEMHDDALAAEGQLVAWSVGIAVVVALLVGAMAIGIVRSINGPLLKIIDGLSGASQEVTSASGQVAESSQSLAEGASEQASSLEEISASLEEMTSQIKQTSDNARKINQMATQNADNSQQANGHVKQTSQFSDECRSAAKSLSDAIGEIRESSDATAKVVKTIDEIAFQTNLLALNAAVEAARAGEAGKGFAVVAEEVRALAQRSAEAAKNTSSLIESSQTSAENGVQVSNQVIEKIEQISTGIKEVKGVVEEVAAASDEQAKLLGEVATASDEQAEGVEQVNTAVSDMDQVVQNNASQAEEGSSASEELSSQAQELSVMVNSLVKLVGAGKTVNVKREQKGGRDGAVRQQPTTDRAQSVANHSSQSSKPALKSKNTMQQQHTNSEKKQQHTNSEKKQQHTNSEKKQNQSAEEVIPFDEDDSFDF